MTRHRSALPLPLLVPAALGAAFLLLPLAGMLVRAPWSALPTEVRSGAVLTSLRLSLETATAATAGALVLGVPLAWVLARLRFPGRGLLRALVTLPLVLPPVVGGVALLLARLRFPGRGLLRALVTLPLVLPPVVGGVALLLAFGRRGVLGQWLYDALGVSLPFTTPGVVVAEAFVAMPFLVVSVEGALRALDVRYDEAAATLGASRWFTFRHVTLPMLAPGVAAGAVLCWARALGEFGATITFAGSFPGVTRTMPLSVYLALQTNPDAAVVLSLVLLAVSVAVLAGLRRRWLPG